MLTVCLIGPDGVGKTTIAKTVEASLSLPAKYIYMGMNPETSNYMLPTTRWWEGRKKRRKHPSTAVKTTKKIRAQATQDIAKIIPKVVFPGIDSSISKGPRYIAIVLVKSFGFVNRIAEEWYRQTIAFLFRQRGYVVIFDRHFIYDYYHYDIAPRNEQRPLKRKIHGFLLKKTLREPDLVICLDAPAEVIYERKQDFSAEVLATMRDRYLRLGALVRNFRVVNANRSPEVVALDVAKLILQFAEGRSKV